MPDCKYYQQGNCRSMLTCQYRHADLPEGAEVCKSFVRGYCSLGLNCKRYHRYTVGSRRDVAITSLSSQRIDNDQCLMSNNLDRQRNYQKVSYEDFINSDTYSASDDGDEGSVTSEDLHNSEVYDDDNEENSIQDSRYRMRDIDGVREIGAFETVDEANNSDDDYVNGQAYSNNSKSRFRSSTIKDTTISSNGENHDIFINGDKFSYSFYHS